MIKRLVVVLAFTLAAAGFVNRALAAEQKPAAKDKAAPAAKPGTDEIVSAIDKYRAEGEKKLVEKKFTKKEVSLTGEKVKDSVRQRWEKLDAYYEGAKLVRLQVYPHKGSTGRTEEFYVKDGKLVFAFIQDKGPKNEGKDMGEPGKEFYFDNDKLVRMVDRSNEKETDPEAAKKMYETRLPYEVKEFQEILAGIH